MKPAKYVGLKLHKQNQFFDNTAGYIRLHSI